MKRLFVGEEVFESPKIYKGVDYVKGSNFKFSGITDFSQFILEEGKEWDIEIDEITQLKINQAIQFETLIELIGGM